VIEQPVEKIISKYVETIHRVSFSLDLHMDSLLINRHSGLAWHTDDAALRAKFEEFGQVDEAVR